MQNGKGGTCLKLPRQHVLESTPADHGGMADILKTGEST
jgi:hypothetical protein